MNWHWNIWSRNTEKNLSTARLKGQVIQGQERFWQLAKVLVQIENYRDRENLAIRDDYIAIKYAERMSDYLS